MGKRKSSSKNKVSTFHGKTIEEIISGVNKVSIEHEGKQVEAELYNNNIPTATSVNVGVGVETERFIIPTKGVDVRDIMAKDKKRQDAIKKAELDGTFSVWVKSILEEVELIRNKLTELNQDEEFVKSSPKTKIDYLMMLFPEFMKNHPIVMQKMVFENAYNKKVFLKYLRLCFDNRCKIMDGTKSTKNNRQDHYTRQADYAKLLYMQVPRYDTKKAKEIWRNVYNAMMDEEKDTKVDEKIVKARLEAEEAEYAKNRLKYITDSLAGRNSELLQALIDAKDYFASKPLLDEEPKEESNTPAPNRYSQYDPESDDE